MDYFLIFGLHVQSRLMVMIMKNYRTKKAIYTEDGTLLLAAGQELTEEILMKLEMIKHKKLTDIVNSKDLQKKDTIIEISNQIQESYKILGGKVVSEASDIVARIIFELKDQPWWLHINALSNYVDWLYAHSVNVSIISTMLAGALSLEAQRESIALGALLHDIGMLMIPKSVLQKNRMLASEDQKLINQHCDLGVSMLSGYDLNQIGLEIIHQHHERLDGSGYPLGLRGDQIPMHSKIVMIADVLDATTSYRPYRPSKSIETALKELSEAKVKYPQDIIDAFTAFI